MWRGGGGGGWGEGEGAGMWVGGGCERGGRIWQEAVAVRVIGSQWCWRWGSVPAAVS